jgi:hypothetical protein
MRRNRLWRVVAVFAAPDLASLAGVGMSAAMDCAALPVGVPFERLLMSRIRR